MIISRGKKIVTYKVCELQLRYILHYFLFQKTAIPVHLSPPRPIIVGSHDVIKKKSTTFPDHPRTKITKHGNHPDQ